MYPKLGSTAGAGALQTKEGDEEVAESVPVRFPPVEKEDGGYGPDPTVG